MKFRHIDTSRKIPALPDGRDPAKLRVNELWRALAALSVPGCNATMGKQALLTAYYEHVERVAADMRAESLMRCVGPLPEAVAAKAVALIGRNAADAL